MHYPPKQRRTGKAQIILVVAFLLGAYIISSIMKTSYSPPEERNIADRVAFVQTAMVEPQDTHIAFEATATIEAEQEIAVVPQVSGRIVSVHPSFKMGGRFSKNEVLFRIDPRDFEMEVRRQKAEVAKAKTAWQLEMAEADAALAEWQQLNPDKQAPALVGRKPQLAEAKANLGAAEAQLHSAKLDLERTRFSLPFAGRVLSTNIAKGQYVSAGQSYGDVFDLSALEARASLSQRQLEWLLGAKEPDIMIHTEYLGVKRTHQLILKQSNASLDAATRFATLQFGFKETSKELVPGVFGDLAIEGSELKDVMVLPAAAMQPQGVVWRVEEGVIRSWNPEVIYADDAYVIVKGLDGPIEVVISRIAGGTDGMRISAASQASEEEQE